MAAGTVAYTDTTGNRDYLGIVASQIGKRLKQASDMASDERAFAEMKAEEGGTSLKEAGIGKGHFFKRALGSRFGGDKIARTRGRLGAQGPGTNPTGNFKTRFRGGFDYNVSNEIQSATAPVTGALATGLRGVEGGLVSIGQSIDGLAVGLGNLARAQEDAARQAVMNGAFMQAFLNHMQREGARGRARSEERGLERRGRIGGGSGGRGMINVTPSRPPGGGGGGGSLLRGLDTFQSGAKAATNVKGIKGAQTLAKQSKQVFRGAGITNLFGTSARVSKAAANKNVLKALGGAGGKTNKKIVQAVQKSGLANTAVKGTSAVKSLKGVERLSKAVKMVDLDASAADEFATGFKNLDMENALIKRIYGSAGDKTIPRKQAAGAYAGLVDGSLDGTARNTDEALAAWKHLFGEDQYKKLMAGADAPISKAFKNTFTHNMLKAPGIPKAMASTAKTGLGKTLLKKIPVIAGIAGIIFGIQRALEGDFLGAGLEISSGLMGATGVGSGLSLGIDGFLLARDMGMMPMARGGLLTQPTNILAGEAGAEGVFPLEGARGKKTFKMFGEGVLDAQKDNPSDVSKLQAGGLKKYFEGMNGWKSFGEALKKIFSGLAKVFKDNPLLSSIFKVFGLDTDSDGDGDGDDKKVNIDPSKFGDGVYGTGLVTGPRGRIGAGDEYHLDTKFSKDMSMEDRVKMMDQLALGYAARGREIEFSNEGVGGTVYNRSASLEDKIKLLKKAQRAHSHSLHSNFDSLDYYIPEISDTKGRFGKSAEGAEILMPTMKGAKLQYGQGGGYGAFVNMVDENGKILMKTGHGDINHARTGTVDLSPPKTSATDLLSLFKTGSNPDGVASALNGQSGQMGMSSFMLPTTIVNNYNTVAGGGSGDDDSFSTGFPSFAQGFIVPFSMDALK